MMRNIGYQKLLLLLTASVVAINSFAQNNKTVNVKNFNSISVNSGIDLHISQGATESVVIKGDDEVIKDVIVEQKQQTITIKYKNGVNWSRLFNGREINVYVTVKNLAALAASGGSDVSSTGTLKTEKLAIATSGGSDIDLNVTCKNISVSASGGSDVQLKGSAENMIVTASGGSDVDAYDFKVNYAQINSSGGSDVNAYVNKALSASATGGSDITYKGAAALNKTATSKSGDVKHVN